MDTAYFAAPFPVRAISRTRTFTASSSTATHRRAYRRLLHALAGPADTAPFHRPRDPRRHRAVLRSADRPR
jgi:hypothetical protein